MPKHGKQYKEAAAKIDRAKLYSPKEAMELVKDVLLQVRRDRRGLHPPGCRHP